MASFSQESISLFWFSLPLILLRVEKSRWKPGEESKIFQSDRFNFLLTHANLNAFLIKNISLM